MGYAQIDHPLPRDEPPRLFDPERRRDGLVTVCDFGARGMGLHDETECFDAYNNWFRSQLSEPNPQRIWTIGRQGFYWLTKTLDWTNYEGVIFDCGPAVIKSKVMDAPAIDARGTSNSRIKYVYIESINYPDHLATAGLYVGGWNKNQTNIIFNIENISISGDYGMAPIVNFGMLNSLASFLSKHIVNYAYNNTQCNPHSNELMPQSVQDPVNEVRQKDSSWTTEPYQHQSEKMLHVIHRGHTESGFFVHALFTQRHVQLIDRLPGNQRSESDRYACIIPLLDYERMHKRSEPDRWHYSDLEPEILSDIRAGRAILIFDLCNEGPALDEDIFAALLNWIEANELPAGRVIWMAQNRAMARSANEVFGPRSQLIAFKSFDFFVRATAWMFSRDSSLPVLGTDIKDAIERQIGAPHRDKILLCMNATPRLPRILTVAALISLGLMNDSLVSFGGMNYVKEGVQLSDIEHFLNLNEEFKPLKSAIDSTLALQNLRIDEFSEQGNALFDKIDPIPYKRTYFSLVTESEWSNGDIIRITEKTMKAFCMGHPTIIVGNPNSIELITELGFLDWSILFDRTYEKELSVNTRFQRIIREVKSQSIKIKDHPQDWLQNANFTSVFNMNHAISGSAFNKYVSTYDIPLINYFKSLVEDNDSPSSRQSLSG